MQVNGGKVGKEKAISPGGGGVSLEDGPIGPVARGNEMTMLYSGGIKRETNGWH